MVGYQAEGTRGRALYEGARDLKINGRMVPVRAHVETVGGLSAHPGRNEILHWLRGFRRPPKMNYVVHAESGPAEALAESIRMQLRWSVTVARDGQSVTIGETNV